MATNSAPKTMTLRSSDGEEFVVQAETFALASGLVKIMLEDDVLAAGVISLPKVKGRILSRIVDYCNRHYGDADAGTFVASPFSSGDPDLERFDADFIGGVDYDTLIDLLVAANYLDVQRLLDLACKTVADQMTGKTVEGMRAHFHIKNDYTPEEEAEVRQKYSWAFE